MMELWSESNQVGSVHITTSPLSTRSTTSSKVYFLSVSSLDVAARDEREEELHVVVIGKVLLLFLEEEK